MKKYGVVAGMFVTGIALASVGLAQEDACKEQNMRTETYFSRLQQELVLTSNLQVELRKAREELVALKAKANGTAQAPASPPTSEPAAPPPPQ